AGRSASARRASPGSPPAVLAVSRAPGGFGTGPESQSSGGRRRRDTGAPARRAQAMPRTLPAPGGALISPLRVGAAAPSSTLLNQDGESVRLSQFTGQRVVLYFYPAAMTPGCTTEASDFRVSLSALKAAGLIVLGISPHKPEKLKKFIDKEGLNFDLLSDEDKTMMEEWGAFGEKKNYGKVVQGVIRSTVVVDAEGRV